MTKLAPERKKVKRRELDFTSDLITSPFCRGHARMHPEYREKLLAVLAKLDQLDSEADAVLAGPGDAEIYAWMEDVREHMVEMRARVEAKLDRPAL